MFDIPKNTDTQIHIYRALQSKSKNNFGTGACFKRGYECGGTIADKSWLEK